MRKENKDSVAARQREACARFIEQAGSASGIRAERCRAAPLVAEERTITVSECKELLRRQKLRVVSHIAANIGDQAAPHVLKAGEETPLISVEDFLADLESEHKP